MPVFGSKIIFLDTVDSTNNYAATLIEKNEAVNGTVVLADYQFSGRGQRSKRWEANKGENLTFSVIWMPDKLSVSTLATINWWVSLTLVRFLDSHGIKAKIKWPNDLLVQRQKIAGLLIENKLHGDQIKSLVIGIGLNVNQSFDAQGLALSMAMITKREWPLRKLLIEFLAFLNHSIDGLDDPQQLKEAYEKELFLYQKQITYTMKNEVYTGLLLGVNEDGQLNVSQQNRTLTFNAGEITLHY